VAKLLVHIQLNVKVGIHSTHQLHFFYHCPKYKVQVWMGSNTSSQMLQLLRQSFNHISWIWPHLAERKFHKLAHLPIYRWYMYLDSVVEQSVSRPGIWNQSSEGVMKSKDKKVSLMAEMGCSAGIDSTWIARSMWFYNFGSWSKSWETAGVHHGEECHMSLKYGI
jgi:hypothetical protein